MHKSQVYTPPVSSQIQDGDNTKTEKVLLWNRKEEGGFPETKVLKQRVRDYIDPGRDLGHSDRGGKKASEKKEEGNVAETTSNSGVGGNACEDCK